jgi:hypothetical protein
MMIEATDLDVQGAASELIRRIEFDTAQWKQVGGCRSKRVRRTLELLTEAEQLLRSHALDGCEDRGKPEPLDQWGSEW